MGNAKLMKLLFYKDNFNADGRRMRAVLDREISNGVDTYRLWRSPGVPDQRYPRAENDTHSLYVEIGEYLVPLYMTDLELIYRSGEQPAITQLYGSDDGRRKYFQGLHKFGQADTAEISKTLQVERETIERLGSEPSHQANFVKEVLNEHMADFIKSKENGGETFPDFIGAAVLNEIALCRELSAKYRAKRRAADAAYNTAAWVGVIWMSIPFPRNGTRCSLPRCCRLQATTRPTTSPVPRAMPNIKRTLFENRSEPICCIKIMETSLQQMTNCLRRAARCSPI